MKKTFLILLLIVITTSCGNDKNNQNPEELLKAKLENKIKPNMNDPESFEFVELKKIDSTTYLQNIDYRLESYTRMLSYSKSDLERMSRYKEEIPSMFDSAKYDKIKYQILQNKNIIKSIDSIKSSIGDEGKRIASFLYSYKIRGKNALGAKVVQNYYVQTKSIEDSLEIINITESKKELHAAPNGFPGYNEILNK